METRQKTHHLSEVNLHVAEAGPENGPVILFLHGFPECWFGWQKQITYFSAQGYRVLAPDQRGYNLSSKPAGVKAYRTELLVADIAELIRKITSEKVTLVGHDWGGAVAWNLADKHPELLEKLIILNMPHPQVLYRALRQNPWQMLRSWYAGFFQLPVLPELLLRLFNFKLLANTLTRTSRPGTFSGEALAQYRKAWRQPGALTAMVNWYRAARYHNQKFQPTIEVPTLLLWGKQDAFLGEEMALPSIEKCTTGQLIFLKNNTHWLHHEAPGRVNELIHNFLRIP